MQEIYTDTHPALHWVEEEMIERQHDMPLLK